jgi:hypothetical protein
VVSSKRSVLRGEEMGSRKVVLTTGSETVRWAGAAVGVTMLFSECRDLTLSGCGRSGAFGC